MRSLVGATLLPVLGLCGVAQAETILRVVPVAADEESGPASARLELDTWYASKSVEIPAAGSGFELPLDRSWLCARWPERCDDPYLRAQIVVRAGDRLLAVSRLFTWLGGLETPGGSPTAGATLRFPGLPAVTVDEGGRATVEIPRRRAGTRILRLVDGRGSPARGVRVAVSAFLRSHGRCRRLVGEPLGDVQTDAGGRATVADGEFTYLLEMMSDSVVFQEPEPDSMQRAKVSALDAPVIVERLAATLLRVEVSGGSGDLRLEGCLRDCAGGLCGECCGQLGAMDEGGGLSLAEFRPRRYSLIRVVDAEGSTFWSSDPLVLDLARPVVIDLRPGHS